MTAPTLLTLTAQPARTLVIMAITARLPLVHAPDLAMAYAARLTNNLYLWEQTPAWRLFPCTYFLPLDFLHAFLRFNVQSTTPLLPFWTSSVHSSASTSNPPLNFFPFGLPPCIPLLQRPIHHSFPFLLDFLRAFHYFNVQSKPARSTFSFIANILIANFPTMCV